MPLSPSYLSNTNVRNKRDKLIQTATLVYDTWTNPLAAVTNGLSVSHTGANAASTRNMTLGGSLCSGGVGTFDFPRNVVITVTHASAVVAMSGTITGTDQSGKTMTEAWSVTAGGTSKTFTGARAFKTITQITETVAADASTNTIIAGSGTKLGLSATCNVASAVKEVMDGTVLTNGTVVAASTSATADARGTYSPNTAPDGAHDYDLWYISNNPAQGF